MKDEDTTIKKQEEYEKKERLIAETIFSRPFVRFLDKTTMELQEENDLKNAELHTKIMQDIAALIVQQDAENIDTRVLTMVFAKALLAVVIGSTNVSVKRKQTKV